MCGMSAGITCVIETSLDFRARDVRRLLRALRKRHYRRLTLNPHSTQNAPARDSERSGLVTSTEEVGLIGHQATLGRDVSVSSMPGRKK